MTTYVGVDPGKMGAIASLIGQSYDVINMPWLGKDLDIQAIKAYLITLPYPAVAVEYQQVFPAQGAVSAFTIGLGYGQLIGLLLGMGIPFETPRPVRWKKDLGIPIGSTKLAAITHARRLFPLAELVTPRGRLIDGRADALLIAEWRRRQG